MQADWTNISSKNVSKTKMYDSLLIFNKTSIKKHKTSIDNYAMYV